MDIQILNPSTAECFTNLFQHIKLFTEYVNITFSKEKLYLQTMDSSRVSIVEIFLPHNWFQNYDLKNEESITIGINSTILFKVLNTRDKQQNIYLKYDNDNSDKFYIDFVSEDKTVFDKHFELPLIELDVDVMQIPEMESDADISLPSTYFAGIINQLEIFGDTIEFSCNEDKIILNSLSVESGKMTVNIDIEDITSYAINEGETMNISFSLNRLHNICMYNKLSKEVEIMLTNNFPMKITYPLNMDEAKMVFYLAPKISED